MNPKVDMYLSEGCGRCSLGGTPQCKVHKWHEELKLLRMFVLDCGLTEELKWSQPCYTYQKKNILLISAFKKYCVISFFKGALLKDENVLLAKPGENSQAVRMARFTNVNEIIEKEIILKDCINEAIEIEKSGLKINFRAKTELIYPEELLKKLDETPALNAAFNELTPGRQRGYILYFSQPKQSKTRESRIEKYIPQILEGKGLNDR